MVIWPTLQTNWWEKTDNSHPLVDAVLKPMNSWHTVTEQRTLYVRQCYCSWRGHVWYTPVHPFTMVHPWKILVRPGLSDTPSWQALHWTTVQVRPFHRSSKMAPSSTSTRERETSDYVTTAEGFLSSRSPERSWPAFSWIASWSTSSKVTYLRANATCIQVEEHRHGVCRSSDPGEECGATSRSLHYFCWPHEGVCEQRGLVDDHVEVWLSA